jgi:hypothetical protein
MRTEPGPKGLDALWTSLEVTGPLWLIETEPDEGEFGHVESVAHGVWRVRTGPRQESDHHVATGPRGSESGLKD